MRHSIRVAWLAMLFGCGCLSCRVEAVRPGLAGAWFGEDDLRRLKNADPASRLEFEWGDGGGRGKGWSARWIGFVTAPASGPVAFHVQTDMAAALEIGGKEIVRAREPGREESGKVEMERGRAYPITLTYFHEGKPESAYLRVHWSWPGQEKTTIAPANLHHTPQQQLQAETETAAAEEPDGTMPRRAARARNVCVYRKAGRFAGWPANYGVWNWGNEILVGHHVGYYKEDKGDGHSIDDDRPRRNVLARSLDGGETWTLEESDCFDDDDDALPCPGGVDFAHPDFIMRCDGRCLFYSYDRGKNWQGPFGFPRSWEDMSSRTDYLVAGPGECLLFLSSKHALVDGGDQDRAFCARTADGGRTFEFLSWMTLEPHTARSVMPSTVRVSATRLVSTMRRRSDARRPGPDETLNWIDAYGSANNGRTWEFLGKVADTDTGFHNGNPPSLVRLADGRLCVTYGYRARPYGIRAKTSLDNGRTWSQEIGLRVDGRTWDLGYPRTVVRADAKLVTIYYFTSLEHPEQHIAASIWHPDDVMASTDSLVAEER